MALSEEQLEIWSRAPSATEGHKLAHTYEMVAAALRENPALNERDYDIYLQGSYANDTNIRNDSDVDIVIQMNSPHYNDGSSLPADERIRMEQAHVDSDYQFSQLKQDVQVALQRKFGATDVEFRGKCLRVAPNSSRIQADVVPCFQYRKYTRFPSYPGNFIEGIKFYNSETGDAIISYPRIHIENSTRKHQSTGERYKPLVRLMKRMKTELIERRVIADDLASSFCVEALVYNVSDHLITGGHSGRLISCLQFLIASYENGTLTGFKCPNEQQPLFDGRRWDVEKATQFINAITDLYLHP